MRSIYSTLLILSLLPACGGDDDGASDPSTSTGDASTGTDTEPTTGEPTTGEPVDLNERELGASASAQCRDAMTHATKLTDAITAGDPAAALAAYTGSDLQAYLVQLDGAEGTADADITAALTLGDPVSLASAHGRLHVALLAHLRAQLSQVKEGTDDHYASWDEAHCIWDGGLRSLGQAADAVTWTAIDEQIVADIDAGFAAGHDGLQGEPPNTSADDWQVPPNRQRVEKSLYRAFHRVLLEQAARARATEDPAPARLALALFASIESRLEGRNTPGIAQIHAILSGAPAAIDPDALRLELDIAFAKRTRTYASAAIDGDELGVPAGYEGAIEGATYARLVAAGMQASLPNFDLAGYLAAWDRYAMLVYRGTAGEELAAISQFLVTTTCAYQTALGVADCSGNVDETE